MVKKSFVFAMITATILPVSCSKRLSPLMMERTPYLGTELRTDGYYYSSLTSTKDMGIAVFYKDGVCFHLWIIPLNEDTLSYIENKILTNTYTDRLKRVPTHIGVFKTAGSDIEMEVWDYGGSGITTFSHYGEIINDTAFIINKMVNNGGKHTFTESLTYRFKPFSPKPDSTCVFIK